MFVKIVNFAMIYGGLKYIHLTECVVLVNIGPILIGVFGYLVYGTDYTLFDLSCAMVAFVGVVFISQPDFIFGSQTDRGESLR